MCKKKYENDMQVDSYLKSVEYACKSVLKTENHQKTLAGKTRGMQVLMA